MLLFSMSLLIGTFVVATLDLFMKPLVSFMMPKSTLINEIFAIDTELRGISENDDFVKWAKLTRKRQQLAQQQIKEDGENQKAISKVLGTIQTVARVALFIFWRAAPVVTLDENMMPVWLLKIASFTGLSFIRYGDVSCFIWYFWYGIYYSVLNLNRVM